MPPPITTRAMAAPAITGVALLAPVSARLVPPAEAALGAGAGLALLPVLPAVLQFTTPVKVFEKPFGPVIWILYAEPSATGTVMVCEAPGATVYCLPASWKVNASSPLLVAMTSTPLLAQSTMAVTAGIAPCLAQVAVAWAVTVLSLEPARIWVWLDLLSPTPWKARPTGTLVVAWTVSAADPSGVPAGTSK